MIIDWWPTGFVDNFHVATVTVNRVLTTRLVRPTGKLGWAAQRQTRRPSLAVADDKMELTISARLANTRMLNLFLPFVFSCY